MTIKNTQPSLVILLFVITVFFSIGGCSFNKEDEPINISDELPLGFVPMLDYVTEEEDSLAVTLLLYSNGGIFDKDISKESISLSGGFADAKDVNVKLLSDSEAEMKFFLPLNGMTSDNFNITATVELASGALLGNDGKTYEELFTDTREYVAVEMTKGIAGSSPIIQNIDTASISQEGINLVIRYESCSLIAYRLPAGIWGIGYGHTENVKKGDVITEAQALELLISDLAKSEKLVKNAVKEGMISFDLTQGMYDALVSFTHQCGSGNFKRLVTGRTAEIIADKFDLFIKSGGSVKKALIQRRNEEKALFLR